MSIYIESEAIRTIHKELLELLIKHDLPVELKQDIRGLIDLIVQVLQFYNTKDGNSVSNQVSDLKKEIDSVKSRVTTVEREVKFTNNRIANIKLSVESDIIDQISELEDYIINLFEYLHYLVVSVPGLEASEYVLKINNMYELLVERKSHRLEV